MKSMELTAAEAKEQYGDCAPCSSDGEGDTPKYPYGLELYLNDTIMRKLGMDTLPPVGSDLVLTARIRVTGVSEREHQKGGGKTEKTQSTDLQITAMELSTPASDALSSAAAKLYPSK